MGKRSVSSGLAVLLGLLVPASSPAAGAARLALAVTPAQVVQGQTLRARIDAGPTIRHVRLRAGARTLPLHRVAGGYQAFLGTSPLTAGRLTLRADGQGPEGPVAATRTVRVRAGTFAVRRLRLPPERARLLAPHLVAEERRRMAAATARPLPLPLWDGRFRRPVPGPVTSPYGVRSVYNGVPGGYHLGVDFRAASGTPVRAAQHGLVTLAEALPLSGVTVVLDHGAGVFTTYQHLSAVLVRVGRRVAPGQVVGRAGATGLSTGPHLHWGMRVHGVRVDPLFWTR